MYLYLASIDLVFLGSSKVEAEHLKDEEFESE